MCADEAFEVGEILDALDLLAENCKIGEELGEVAGHAREASERKWASVERKFALDELQQHPRAFADVGRRDAGPPQDERSRLLKDPRIAQTSTANSHAVCPRLFEETNRVDRFAHTTAAEHRDVDGLFDAGYDGPVGSPDVTLRNAASMDIDGRSTCQFSELSYLDGCFPLAVRSGAYLERYRNIDSFDDGSH